MGPVLDVIEVALIVVTFAWVGKRPTAAKVSGIIAVVWLVEFGALAMNAAGQGVSVHDLAFQTISPALDSARDAASPDQRESVEEMADVLAGCVPGFYALSAGARVFAALCARWVLDRVRHKTQWTPFSMVDLSVWWVVPLMVGIVLYIVSILPGAPAHDEVSTASMNVLMVSTLPLFVQGAAAGKGVMNRMGVQLAWQLVLGFFMLVSGLAFLVLPLMGLIDFWANFRRLPRDGAGSSGSGSEQGCLPD